MTPEQMHQMTKQGIELEDGLVRFEKLTDEGGEGFNHWYRLVLKEGRNRVVRRTFEALSLTVSRLMRVRFGIVNLPPSIKRGKMAELGEEEIKMILDWVGLSSEVVEKQPPAKITRSRPSKDANREVEPKEVRAPTANKTKGRRGQADMSRSRLQRKGS